MNRRYPFVADRAGHRCEYCRAPESVFNFAFEVEHIIPVSRDGKDISDNWALACRSCNLHKGASIMSIDPITGQTPPLFHPRLQTWADHFQIDIQTGHISGLTPVGRATISRLDLNSQEQVAARKIWIQLEIYP